MVAPIVQGARAAVMINRMKRGAENKEVRIGNVTAVLLIMVALLFDLAQFVITVIFGFVPLAGPGLIITATWFISMFAQIAFAIWFALLHVRGGARQTAFAIRMLVYISVFVVELVPIINSIPAITLGVVALIVLSRAEDLLGDARKFRLSQSIRLLRGQQPRAPLPQEPPVPREDISRMQMANEEVEDTKQYYEELKKEYRSVADYQEALKQQAVAGALRKRQEQVEQTRLYAAGERYKRRYGTPDSK